APLNHVDNRVKLQPVNQARMAEERKAVQLTRDLGKQRAKLEGQVKASPLAPGVGAAVPVKMDLPAIRPPAPLPDTVKVPPHPSPALVTKPILTGDPGKPIGQPEPIKRVEDKKPLVVTPDPTSTPKPGNTKPPDDKKPMVTPDPKPMPKPGTTK